MENIISPVDNNTSSNLVAFLWLLSQRHFFKNDTVIGASTHSKLINK